MTQMIFIIMKIYKNTQENDKITIINFSHFENFNMVCSIVFYNNFTYNFENTLKKCDVSNLFFKKIFGESKDKFLNIIKNKILPDKKNG
ncbi:hypothetical protein BpHYR1_009735 [Brachionus plicatilis]|uniref:Uncharacterized protein n=1 Tax=Brachionus plicatilis TaxID=10195 RepID=A0A3M7R4C3_BRAPC|nr:hypothetical protein BpHYR1_009735 [Brachionus plicatilis]